MIQIVTGKLGAGKTLFTVMHMFDHLCKGRRVATNIDIDWPEMVALARRVRRVELVPEQLLRINPGVDPNWHTLVPWGDPAFPVEVYLDEIHLFFNARNWQVTQQRCEQLLSFLSQSRKAGINVTFIAQEITTIDKQFRDQAEWELFVLNSSHIPLGPLGKCPFNFFVVVKRDPRNSNVLDKTVRSYDKRFWRVYRSYSFLDDAMQSLAEQKPRVSPVRLSKVSRVRLFYEACARSLSSLARLIRPRK
jgi:hypothetical protein